MSAMQNCKKQKMNPSPISHDCIEAEMRREHKKKKKFTQKKIPPEQERWNGGVRLKIRATTVIWRGRKIRCLSANQVIFNLKVYFQITEQTKQ